MKNVRKRLLVLLIVSLLLAGCGSNPGSGDSNNNNDSQDDGFNFSEQELEENQPGEEGMEFSENEGEDPNGNPENDDEVSIDFAEADDVCLEGTWLLNIGAFAEGLELTMNENLTNGFFDVTPVMGELRLIFDGDFVEMQTDVPLFFKVNFTAAGLLLSEMEIEVTSNGTAHWVSGDSHIVFYGQDVHAEGSGDWESEIIGAAGSSTGNSGVVSLDYSMGDLIVHSDVIDLSSLGVDLPEDQEQVAQFYDCDAADLLLFTGAGAYNEQWFSRE